MSAKRLSNYGLTLLSTALVLHPPAAWACAVCFGKSDSSLAKGMNMGIFAMLVVVVGMWMAFGAFFVFLARRATSTSKKELATSATNERVSTER